MKTASAAATDSAITSLAGLCLTAPNHTQGSGPCVSLWGRALGTPGTGVGAQANTNASTGHALGSGPGLCVTRSTTGA
jgi:hypothetical protein